MEFCSRFEGRHGLFDLSDYREKGGANLSGISFKRLSTRGKRREAPNQRNEWAFPLFLE